MPTYARADQVVLDSSKDNTLFEDGAGALSNGAGSFFYVGQNGLSGGNLNRRGLIAFDVASFVPAGSIITSVQLDVTVSQSLVSSNVALHRVSQDWGEGASNSDGGGLGGGAAGCRAEHDAGLDLGIGQCVEAHDPGEQIPIVVLVLPVLVGDPVGAAYTTSVEVYDTQGQPILAAFTFTKSIIRSPVPQVSGSLVIAYTVGFGSVPLKVTLPVMLPASGTSPTW